MRKLSKSEWITLSGAILLINCLTLWCIDVSSSALINEAMMDIAGAYGGKPIDMSMETGLISIFKANPQITYHVAAYINIIITFLMFMIFIHVVAKDEKK